MNVTMLCLVHTHSIQRSAKTRKEKYFEFEFHIVLFWSFTQTYKRHMIASKAIVAVITKFTHNKGNEKNISKATEQVTSDFCSRCTYTLKHISNAVAFKCVSSTVYDRSALENSNLFFVDNFFSLSSAQYVISTQTHIASLLARYVHIYVSLNVLVTWTSVVYSQSLKNDRSRDTRKKGLLSI